MQVFLRAGVVAINADSPVQRTLCNCKRSGSGTFKPCNVCNVTQDELGDGQYDIAGNARTMDGIDHSLSLVRKEATKTKQGIVSTREGVVGAFVRNPVREHLHLNPVKSIGVDIMHQDSLVSSVSCWPQQARGNTPLVVRIVTSVFYRSEPLLCSRSYRQ